VNVNALKIAPKCSGSGKGGKGGICPGQHCAGGAALGGAKIWNSEILHLQLSILFTVHTNAIIVTIKITIGDLISGVGVATKTFAPGSTCPHAATAKMQSFGFVQRFNFFPKISKTL